MYYYQNAREGGGDYEGREGSERDISVSLEVGLQ